MKVKVLETFGYFKPGPDAEHSGPYVEHVGGQVLTDSDIPDAKTKEDWVGKGHVEDLEPAPAPAPSDHTA